MNKLYPNINDPTFNVKIAKRKEFNEQSFQMPIVDDVEKESDRLCSMKFELSPHQQFVKNFLSIQTPYNSLLLYHGLGTGKTCSAIGVSEEMRNYMKQMGIQKKIIIVASPNVQGNFKQQLFDDRKMKKVGGVWDIQACSGNRFLAEINPVQLKGLSKEKILAQVQRIIRSYYTFMGYVEFANFIRKSAAVSPDLPQEKQSEIRRKKLERVFANRLIVIDEVHNIRMGDDKQKKRVAVWLDKLVREVHPLRLLLMSATPMYNDPREIVWLLNLMNMNDGRSTIDVREVFDKDGNFVVDDKGVETGRELLMRKATGYVSFLRGDNPYTFPYRIFPRQFEDKKSLTGKEYPTKGITGNRIFQRMEHLDLFCVNVKKFQLAVYETIVEKMRQSAGEKKMPTPENMERFGYTVLQKPLEALNMVYPAEEDEIGDMPVNELVGQGGLDRIMKSSRKKTDFEYRDSIIKKYGPIFSPGLIGDYSSKIAEITSEVSESEGIALVYSQFLDGGLVPLALALEERGFARFGADSLFKKGASSGGASKGDIPHYVMITGDKDLSPNNTLAVKEASAEANKDGANIKVILISRAGSEGLDFKNIRQVHIMEPWYNTNRLEQTIGRAVRTCSHSALPFSKRNVMIFLYTTLLKSGDEAADMYVYRIAEMKAVLIGKVSRALKEGAVDCLLNSEQMNGAVELLGQAKKMTLANGRKINYEIGDKPFSQLCDYMESCTYTCSPNATIKADDLTTDTYTLQVNDSIVRKIKDFFKEHYFYKKDELVRMLNYHRAYSMEQINAALNNLVTDKTEIVEDRYGRVGNIVNIGEYYFFQPAELENSHISTFDRDRPIAYKRNKVIEELTKEFTGDDFEAQQKISEYEKLFQTAFTRYESIKKSDKNWYRNASKAIEKLVASGMRLELLEEYVMGHIWDTMSNDDKLQMLNLLFSPRLDQLGDFAKRMKGQIVDPRIFRVGSQMGYYITELENVDGKMKFQPKLFVFNSDESEWREGKKTDKQAFIGEYAKESGKIVKHLSPVFGFIIHFKTGSELIFKTKIRDMKRQSGARCDQASKKESLKTLNEILALVRSGKTAKGEECSTQLFDEETTKTVSTIELCCYTELLLRCYNGHKLQKNIWFVHPEFSQTVMDNLR